MNSEPSYKETSILLATFSAFVPASVCVVAALMPKENFTFNKFAAIFTACTSLYSMIAGAIYFRMAGKPMVLSIFLAIVITPLVLFANFALLVAIVFAGCVCGAFSGRSPL